MATRPMGMFSTKLSEKALILDSEVFAERYPWARKREMTPEQPIRTKMTDIQIMCRVSCSLAAMIGPISMPTKIINPDDSPMDLSFADDDGWLADFEPSRNPRKGFFVGENWRYTSNVSAPSVLGTCRHSTFSDAAIRVRSRSVP